MPLKDPAYCLTRAEECERLAANAAGAETREIMIYLANRWRTLAEQDETQKKTPGKPQSALPSP
jgi:hypothetical protein